MSAKVDSLLPGRWAAAHLPALSPEQLTQVKSLTTVGAAPVTHSTPPQLAAAMTSVTHATFISGMSVAFTVASIVALAGAALALLAKPGREVEAAATAGI